ncbi:MAG: class I SAM-dependent methyltransferase [Pseudomonadota bacterium]
MNAKDEDFQKRREAARAQLSALPGNDAPDAAGRRHFFDAVYERAAGDEAAIPWADLEAKPELLSYLADHPGKRRRALDIACGLGDNAEALANAGYTTIAFDIAEEAIAWAKKRFPETAVSYETADLFNPPESWAPGFDLVHECYTLQALPPEGVEETARAICRLVAPGGTLLVYSRTRPDGADADGPPWPLEETNLRLPERFGLTQVSDKRFSISRGDRVIDHSFAVWHRPA